MRLFERAVRKGDVKVSFGYQYGSEQAAPEEPIDVTPRAERPARIRR